MANAKRFLIVDDDADDREFFCDAVSQISSSHQCQEAINGVEALKKLREEPDQLPDYIFLDLNMPCMDGKTMLMELKKDALLKDIPVVIFSTSSDSRDKEDMQLLGAAFFITKPYKLDVLCKNIRSILEPSYLRQD